jgi:hypothetical protein
MFLVVVVVVAAAVVDVVDDITPVLFRYVSR